MGKNKKPKPKKFPLHTFLPMDLSIRHISKFVLFIIYHVGVFALVRGHYLASDSSGKVISTGESTANKDTFTRTLALISNIAVWPTGGMIAIRSLAELFDVFKAHPEVLKYEKAVRATHSASHSLAALTAYQSILHLATDSVEYIVHKVDPFTRWALYILVGVLIAVSILEGLGILRMPGIDVDEFEDSQSIYMRKRSIVVALLNLMWGIIVAVETHLKFTTYFPVLILFASGSAMLLFNGLATLAILFESSVMDKYSTCTKRILSTPFIAAILILIGSLVQLKDEYDNINVMQRPEIIILCSWPVFWSVYRLLRRLWDGDASNSADDETNETVDNLAYGL